MHFCTNCGEQIADGVKFCPQCGVPANDTPYVKQDVRKIIYAGEVRKCPACGAELPSMVAVCPSCGYEINSQQVHPILEKLAAELNECDYQIAIEDQSGIGKKSGWSAWENWEKIGWVILNIVTFGVPLIIYRLRTTRPHTPAAAKKATLIENLQIPNEKAAICDILYFMQEKVNALSVQGANEVTLYWLKLWKIKAKHIYEKALVLLPDDKFASNIYEDIADKTKKVKNVTLLKRTGMVTLLFVLIAISVGIFSFAGRTLAQNRIHRIHPPISANEIEGKNCGVVVRQFRDAGFTNVKTEKIEDLIIGWLTKDGEIEQISINGGTDFTKWNSFAADANVVVTYHTFPGGKTKTTVNTS